MSVAVSGPHAHSIKNAESLQEVRSFAGITWLFEGSQC
jgi:hypothetical protein